MKSLRFATTIHAPRKAAWDAMLAPDTYRIWTGPFMEGSYYEGSWEKGARIRFLAPDGRGMASVIEENRLHEFLSIKHLGMIKDGVEDLESDGSGARYPNLSLFVPADRVPADREAPSPVLV